MSVPFGIPNSGNSCWLAAATQALLSITCITPQRLMTAPVFPASEHVKFYTANITPEQITKIRDAILNNTELCEFMGGSPTAQRCADEYIPKLVTSSKILDSFCRVDADETTTCKQCGDIKLIKNEQCFINYHQHLEPATTPAIFSKNIWSHFDEFMGRCDTCNTTTTRRRVYTTRFIDKVIMIKFINHVNIPLHRSFTMNTAKGIRVYNLVAAIIHGGSSDPTKPTSGHYTAHVKRGDKWYYTNDSVITPEDGPPATTAGSPLVIYELA